MWLWSHVLHSAKPRVTAAESDVTQGPRICDECLLHSDALGRAAGRNIAALSS